jgi:SAM-dependent methyltransferase
MKITLCKICGKETTHFRHPKFDIIFHECDYCKFLFKDELMYLSREEELKVYERHENTIENIGYVNYLNNFIDTAVLPFINQGKVLDFGSGPNPVLSFLLKQSGSFDVDIYDYYYSPLKVYEHHTYDLITTTEVIEHLQDPMTYFKLFYDLLNQGGLLSIMTLFRPKSHLDIFNWFYIRDQSHVSFFNEQSLKAIADHIGFKFIYHNEYRVAVFKKE